MRIHVWFFRREKRQLHIRRFRRRVRDRERRFVPPSIAAHTAAEDGDEEIFGGVGGERRSRQQTADSGQQENPLQGSAVRCPLSAARHHRSVQYRTTHSFPVPMSALLYAVTAAAAIACLRLVTPLSRRAMVVLALLPLCLTG